MAARVRRGPFGGMSGRRDNPLIAAAAAVDGRPFPTEDVASVLLRVAVCNSQALFPSRRSAETGKPIDRRELQTGWTIRQIGWTPTKQMGGWEMFGRRRWPCGHAGLTAVAV